MLFHAQTHCFSSIYEGTSLYTTDSVLVNTKPPQGFELLLNITWARVGISSYMLLSASWFLWILIFVLLTNEGVENRGNEGEIHCSAASAVTCKPAPSKESKPEQKSKARGATSPPSGVQCYCRRARPAFRWCNPLWWIMKCVTLNQTFFCLSLSFKSLLCNYVQLSRRGKMARLMDFSL